MLVGAQEPRVCFRPTWESEEAGREAIDLYATTGQKLDPWQGYATTVILAEREDGTWAARETGTLVARQNGKGGILEAVTLHGMILVKDPLTLWTSHQFKTSSESFLRMKALFDNTDWLRRRVKSISESHGEEGIELLPQWGGCRLRFLARSKSSGRGFSPQRIIWDEAQELPRWAHSAMQPSMRAQANPQGVFCGTVPNDQVNHPELWTRMRDRGRAGTGKRLAWMEWTPEGSQDPDTAEKLDLHDRAHWASSNPALGYRITEETIEQDLEELGEDARIEVLSIWPSVDPNAGTGVLDQTRWAKRARPNHPRPRGTSVVALDVNPERSSGTIAVAATGAKGRTLLMVRCFERIDQIVPELCRLLRKRAVLDTVLHPTSQTGSLIPDLVAEGITFTALNTTQMGQATSAFIQGVEKGRYWHLDQPELNAAIAGAVTRRVGEAELWDRKDTTVDLSPLVAASEAAYVFAARGGDYDLDSSVY